MASDSDAKLTTSYPRLFGGIQGVFGLTEGAAGAATRNPFLMGKGGDDAAAGFTTAIFTGEPTRSFGSHGLSAVTGLPPEYADVMYDLAGGVAGASSANRAVSAGSVATGANQTFLSHVEPPQGKAYVGRIYRYENPSRVDTTFTTHPGNVAANHRYSGPGEGAIYGGTSSDTALAEVKHYGAEIGRIPVERG